MCIARVLVSRLPTCEMCVVFSGKTRGRLSRLLRMTIAGQIGAAETGCNLKLTLVSQLIHTREFDLRARIADSDSLNN